MRQNLSYKNPEEFNNQSPPYGKNKLSLRDGDGDLVENKYITLNKSPENGNYLNENSQKYKKNTNSESQKKIKNNNLSYSEENSNVSESDKLSSYAPSERTKSNNIKY